MMKKFITVSLLFCFIFINTSLAQEKFSDIAIDKAKYKDIKKLLVLVGSENMGMQVISQMVTYYKNSMPNVPETFWQEYISKCNLSMNELIEMTIVIYAKYFTHEEIKGMIEYWESPFGRKFLSLQPRIMMKSMEAGRIWGEKLNRELEEELIRKGYKTQG